MGTVEIKGESQSISSSRSSEPGLLREGISRLNASKITLFKPRVSPNLSVRY